MSASTEKKNRTAARADGTDKKTVAARKEAEKKRKDTIKWSIVGAIIVVFVLAVIYLNTGMFFRSTTAYSVDISEYQGDDFTIAADTVDFSIAQVNYMYRFNYTQFVSQYGSMISYLGLDTSKPLKSQTCAMGGEEGYTWFDYFMDSTKNQLRTYAITAAYAKANGIELSDADKAAIDSAYETLSENAKQSGFSSAEKFLSANYGKGCNKSVFRSVLEMEYISSAVQNTIMNAKDFTADEIKDYYETVAGDYDNFSYSYYLVAAEVAEAAEGETAAPTAEAMAAAKESAQKIMDAVAGQDLEAAVISVLGESVVPAAEEDAAEGADQERTASTTQTDVAGNTIEAALADWLKSADRQSGDMDIVEAENVGYYVVIFKDRHTVTEPTEESGDVAYCDYIAEQLLRQDELNNWSESVYAKIAEGVTVDSGFGARYIG